MSGACLSLQLVVIRESRSSKNPWRGTMVFLKGRVPAAPHFQRLSPTSHPSQPHPLIPKARPMMKTNSGSLFLAGTHRAPACLPPCLLQNYPLPPAKEVIRWAITLNGKETILKERCIKIKEK